MCSFRPASFRPARGSSSLSKRLLKATEQCGTRGNFYCKGNASALAGPMRQVLAIPTVIAVTMMAGCSLAPGPQDPPGPPGLQAGDVGPAGPIGPAGPSV
jgi:hypothetical protein